jgi:hypothetical protein
VTLSPKRKPGKTNSCTGHPLLTIPPSGYTPVLKEIPIPSGTIGFRFTKFEPGYDYGAMSNIVVRVCSGRGPGMGFGLNVLFAHVRRAV